jgi:hypothetical protein
MMDNPLAGYQGSSLKSSQGSPSISPKKIDFQASNKPDLKVSIDFKPDTPSTSPVPMMNDNENSPRGSNTGSVRENPSILIKENSNTRLLSPRKSVRFSEQHEVNNIGHQDSQETRDDGVIAEINIAESKLKSGISDLTEDSSGQTSTVGPVSNDEVYEDDNLDNLILRRNVGKSLSMDSSMSDHPSDQPRQTLNSSFHMSSTEALHIGLILSEQERMYGTNMYESLQAGDEHTIQYYNSQGYTTEEAILKIFEDRYVHRKPPEVIKQEQAVAEQVMKFNPFST